MATPAQNFKSEYAESFKRLYPASEISQVSKRLRIEPDRLVFTALHFFLNLPKSQQFDSVIDLVQAENNIIENDARAA